MCESCIFLSMKSLYDELEKVCSVFVHVLCVHVWSNSLIASHPSVVLSSVSPQKYTSLSCEPVRKKKTKTKNRELARKPAASSLSANQPVTVYQLFVVTCFPQQFVLI